MAVELVPKQKVRKKLEFSVKDIAFYAVISIAAGLVLAYIGFYLFENNVKARIGEIDKEIANKRTAESQLLEKNVLGFQRKLTTYKEILDSRKKPSKFFPFLGVSTHDQIYYPAFELDLRQTSINLSASPQSFKVLREQVFIFNENSFIGEAFLPDVKLSKEGIEAEIFLPLNLEAFK